MATIILIIPRNCSNTFHKNKIRFTSSFIVWGFPRFIAEMSNLLYDLNSEYYNLKKFYLQYTPKTFFSNTLFFLNFVSERSLSRFTFEIRSSYESLIADPINILQKPSTYSQSICSSEQIIVSSYTRQFCPLLQSAFCWDLKLVK